MALPRAVILNFLEYLRSDFQSLSFWTSPRGKTECKTLATFRSVSCHPSDDYITLQSAAMLSAVLIQPDADRLARLPRGSPGAIL
jgi:hypothetical protein